MNSDLSAEFATAQTKPVYLVGSGPGSPELLTVQAHRLISTADCLLHDDLVPMPILELASPSCLVRNVGKRCGKKTVTQVQINCWMIEYAQAGQCVVRLKSGDPLLFGRATEEMAALAEAKVPFEIVPGISAGFAAAAFSRVSLTGRVTNSRVLLATRHLAAGDTGGLSNIAPDVSLVLYMPGSDYALVQSELMAQGWPGGANCILASDLTSPKQQIITCALDQLYSSAPLPPPVVMLIIPPERS